VNYLQSNTASQTLLLSLKEGSLLFSTTYTDYLLVLQNELTSELLYVIPTIINENERITTLGISTNADDPTNASILIAHGGRWSYIVYGQNSDTNLDPTSNDVVGEIQRGFIQFSSLIDYYDQPTLTIPSDIEYNNA
jgi:hypothetical protein